MNLSTLLKRQWLLLLIPLAVFGWNLLYTFTQAEAPALTPVKTEKEAQRVVRVYEGFRDLDGGGGERPPLASLMLTVWVRNFDGWLHDRVLSYPKTLEGGSYTLTDLNTYWLRKPEERTVEDKDRFNNWLRDSLSQVRLTIGSEVFETILPDPVQSSSEAVASDTARDYTWTRVTFRHMEPGKDEEGKMKQLVQVYGSECTAPVSLSYPFMDARGEKRYVTMKSLVNEGPAAQAQNFSLPLRPRIMRALAWAALAAVLLFLANVSQQTGVLRDTVPTDCPAITHWTQSPWSASRVVFAWWLAICTGCYLFLWAMQGSMNVLSGSAPLLLGINGGTLLAAAWVTDSQRRKASGAGSPPIATRGFLTDIVSEGADAEVSKLQMLVWNGVLGVVFVWETLSDWEMPKFNENLMTLLGISATAYVGYKASK